MIDVFDVYDWRCLYLSAAIAVTLGIQHNTVCWTVDAFLFCSSYMLLSRASGRSQYSNTYTLSVVVDCILQAILILRYPQ